MRIISLTKEFTTDLTQVEQTIMLRLMFEADDDGLAPFPEREMSRDFNVSRHQIRAIRKKLIDTCFLCEPTTLPTTFRPPFRPLQNFVKVCDTNICWVQKEEARPPLRPLSDHPFDHFLSKNDTETDEIEIKGETFDIKKFVRFWNETMEKSRSVIPTISKVGKTRRGLILGRAREHGKRAMAAVAQKSAASDFLNGKNSAGWIANFDWIFKPTNFIKVLDGNYDNNQSQQYGQVSQGYNNGGHEERKRREEGAAALITNLLNKDGDGDDGR